MLRGGIAKRDPGGHPSHDWLHIMGIPDNYYYLLRVRSSHAITVGFFFLLQTRFLTVEPAVLWNDRSRPFFVTAAQKNDRRLGGHFFGLRSLLWGLFFGLRSFYRATVFLLLLNMPVVVTFLKSGCCSLPIVAHTIIWLLNKYLNARQTAALTACTRTILL